MKRSFEKIRVLVLVDHALGISGPHRNVVGTLNALTARDDVTVLLYTGEIDAQEPYARSENIKIIKGYFPHRMRRILANILLLVRAFGTYDLVYVPTNLKSLLYAQILRFGKPLIAGPNVSPVMPLHGKSHATKLEVHWLCDHWIEPSNVYCGFCLAEGVKKERISVVHHAIDHRKFSPDKADRSMWLKMGIRDNDCIVLFVGRFNEELKGYKLLYEAWKLMSNFPCFEYAWLILIGPGSKEFLAENPMDHCVALGRVLGNDLARLYASGDVCAVPSLWETFPFVVLESMASGLATVASKVGGIPEQIDDHENGVLVQLTHGDRPGFLQNASQRLADALVEMIDDDRKRKKIGQTARKKVLEYFSEERLGDELVAIFKKHVAGGSSQYEVTITA